MYRAFLETKLPEFRSKNPHIIVETEIRRGPTRHPYIAAEYGSRYLFQSGCLHRAVLYDFYYTNDVYTVSGKVENGKIRPKAVGLRNLEPKEIERHLNILRGSVGTGKRDFHQKQVTFHPSIQGTLI